MAAYIKTDDKSHIVMKEKDFVKWDPKYKVGIPVIDEQHEHLVTLCNEFYQSLLKNNNEQSYNSLVRQTLEECLKYAGTHFKEEERLMLASGYDGYKHHKHVHDSFTEKVQIAYASFERLPVAEAIKFARFLYEWVHTHIAHEDRLYIPHLVKFLQQNASKNS